MAEKVYVSYNGVHQLLVDTASKVLESDFKPDFIVAIGGGGFIPCKSLRFLGVSSLTVTHTD